MNTQKIPGAQAPSLHQLLAFTPEPGFLADRVVLVTGAADGIGRSVAAAYARHGAQTILLDWHRSGLEEAYKQFVESGWPEPVLCPVDFSSMTLAHLRDIATEVERRFGLLDGLLNNAAWAGELTPFEHYAPKTWAKVMNVNLAAPFFLTQWLMPLLRKSTDPVVVFSLHACAKAYWNGFAMAKAGQEALMQVLAREYAPDTSHPVRRMTISPLGEIVMRCGMQRPSAGSLCKRHVAWRGRL
jgi:NAD(P)-dependent dehydrogenase (short-subunit alcohol dehydrogenase family)